MKKELFIEAIEAIKKQFDLDSEVSTHLGKAFPDAFEANLLPRNHLLQNALIHVLQVEMNDLELCEYGLSWIEYFLWELNFGEKNHLLKVTQNGKEIKMSTAGELYDFLENNKVKHEVKKSVKRKKYNSSDSGICQSCGTPLTNCIC
jgi:hypothetical protein